MSRYRCRWNRKPPSTAHWIPRAAGQFFSRGLLLSEYRWLVRRWALTAGCTQLRENCAHGRFAGTPGRVSRWQWERVLHAAAGTRTPAAPAGNKGQGADENWGGIGLPKRRRKPLRQEKRTLARRRWSW